MPRRSQKWVWAGRATFAVIIVCLVGYLAVAGLEKADKIASCIGVVAALAALVAPYLLPRAEVTPEIDEVRDSNDAQATGGGRANTGLDSEDDSGRATRVIRSGKAVADGRGSVANTGKISGSLDRERP